VGRGINFKFPGFPRFFRGGGGRGERGGKLVINPRQRKKLHLVGWQIPIDDMYEDLFLSAFAFDQETVQICGKHMLTLFGFAVVPFTEVR